MLYSKTLLQARDILKRLANSEDVSFEERVFIQEIASKDQSVNAWLTRARRIQQNEKVSNEIDELLTNLDIGSNEPNSFYKPEQEDLGEWFTGAPSWLARS